MSLVSAMRFDDLKRCAENVSIYTPDELALAAKLSGILENISKKMYAPEEIQEFTDALENLETFQPLSDFDMETFSYCVTGWWVLKNLKTQDESIPLENKTPLPKDGVSSDSVIVE